MFETNFQRGVLAVTGCILVQISVGEINLLGFLYPYFVSYFRIYNPGLKIEQMRAIPTYWLLAQIYSCPLGVYTFTKIGFRYTYLLFITSFCIVQWLSSYITNWYLFSFVYGVSGGTSQGALLILPLYCCWRYFPAEYKPRISGLVLSAYAISPLFTSILALWAINPQNEKQTDRGEDNKLYFSQEVAMRVPSFLKLFGVICAVIGYLGTFLVLEPLYVEQEVMGTNAYEMAMLDNKEEIATPRKEVDKSIKAEHSEKLKEQIQNITHVSLEEAKTLFKIEEYRAMYIIMILGFLFPHMMNFSFKTIGLLYLENDAYVTFIGSLGAAVNAVSRLFVGMLYQRYGYLAVGLSILALEVVTALGFLLFARHPASYLVATCAFEVTYGGQLGMYPLLSDRLFKKKGAMYYAYLFSSFTVSLIVSLNAYSFLKEFNLFVPFMVVAVLTASALPFAVRIARFDATARSQPTL